MTLAISNRLEGEFCGELNASRTSAAEEGIAEADVSGCVDGVEAGADFTRAALGEAVGCGVCDECGQQRAGEVGMIHDVEELGSQLERDRFCKVGVLVEGKVPVLIGEAAQRCAAEVAEMAGSGNAVLCCSGDAVGQSVG